MHVKQEESLTVNMQTHNWEYVLLFVQQLLFLLLDKILLILVFKQGIALLTNGQMIFIIREFVLANAQIQE